METAYEKASHHIELICCAESERQLRVQILLLEDEIDELRVRLIHDDDRVDALERSNGTLHEDLLACRTRLESAQGELRVKFREIETMKVKDKTLGRRHYKILSKSIKG